MNKPLVVRLLAVIVLIEAACMLPSVMVSLIYRDGDTLALLIPMLLMIAVSLPLYLLIKPAERNMRAKEGFFVAGFSWVVLSLLGAIPMSLSGMIPNYLDAVFESVSGFTTTGATVIDHFEGLPHGIMFWRAFTHWIGGMGVLVLTLALLPKLTDRTGHLMRAESPGPSLSKIVPKVHDTAKILYAIYLGLTVAEVLVLVVAGLTPYDALLHTFSNAGTGGFSCYGESIAAFNKPAVEWIIAIFMLLYGVNFTIYYQLLTKKWRDALRSGELRLYFSIVLVSVVGIAVMILPQVGSISTAVRHSAFETASFISTTGFGLADFNSWPQGAQTILVLLMLTGACAGSTAGGLKIIRISVLAKACRREIVRTVQPRKVQVIRSEGKPLDEVQVSQICVFGIVYAALLFLGALLISLENRYDFTTNFTSALSSISNIGPVLSRFRISSVSGYGPFAKIIMCVLMLCGRLELFPILVLFHPFIWKKR